MGLKTKAEGITWVDQREREGIPHIHGGFTVPSMGACLFGDTGLASWFVTIGVRTGKGVSHGGDGADSLDGLNR